MIVAAAVLATRAAAGGALRKLPSARLELGSVVLTSAPSCRAYARSRLSYMSAGHASQPLSALSAPPVQEGKSFMPFQLEGIDWIRRRRNAILADEMGLGKTITAIGVINGLESISSVLIICPKSLMLMWEAELGAWLTRPFDIVVGLGPGGSDEPSATETVAAQGKVVIINYEMVTKRLDQLLAHGVWDMLICDEAHALKNPEAKRTAAITGPVSRGKQKKGGKVGSPLLLEGPILADRTLLITGTPLLNRPIELWPLLRAVDPTAEFVKFADNYDEFALYFCAAKLVKLKRRQFWDRLGSSHVEELRESLRHVMLRREKADALPDLPSKLFQTIPLDNSAVRAAEMRALTAAFEEATDSAIDSTADSAVDITADSAVDLSAELDDPLASAATAATAEAAANGDAISGFAQSGEEISGDAISWMDLSTATLQRADALKRAYSETLKRRVDFLKITSARKETALAKVPAALELIKQFTTLDSTDDEMGSEKAAGRKIVVFAHHREVIDRLMEGIGRQAVRLTGQETSAQRQQAVLRFQTDPTALVFVGSIRAAGTGVTLTAASHVLFVELDWSPGVMAQAEDRCHRVGQKDSVLVSFLVFKGTLDESLAQMLIAKQQTITSIISVSTTSPQSAFDTASASSSQSGLPPEIQPPVPADIQKSAVASAMLSVIVEDSNREFEAAGAAVEGALEIPFVDAEPAEGAFDKPFVDPEPQCDVLVTVEVALIDDGFKAAYERLEAALRGSIALRARLDAKILEQAPATVASVARAERNLNFRKFERARIMARDLAQAAQGAEPVETRRGRGRPRRTSTEQALDNSQVAVAETGSFRDDVSDCEGRAQPGDEMAPSPLLRPPTRRGRAASPPDDKDESD
mmetsp:Transcript_39332/g.91103  ORF Transcript_39332/g.91103 Transcript_39332/m.91103 type:complete len:872 (-) Transcript_39332:41-2656(-)